MLKIPVIAGTVLGVNVYRGFAPLRDLSRISKPDIYDAINNPKGTQRDLSPKHAKEAYEYVRNSEFGYWPEVFLCARDPKAMKFKSTSKDAAFGILEINDSLAARSKKIVISRVDGNHRLYYGDGSVEGFAPIDKIVSFCITDNIDLVKELVIFRDINNNQKRMNTSHLDKIDARLAGQENIKTRAPELYIAERLATDQESPFLNLVYEGGRRPVGAFIPLRTLKTGIEYMFSRPTKLNALNDAEAQYKIIRNYFNAVRKWESEPWSYPRKYLLLRGAGLWAACFVGAEVIDRTLGQGKYKTDDMLKVLKSGKKWDWSNEGDFKGLGGRGGAIRIRDLVVGEFADETGVSVRSLFQKIMSDG
jgi:DGQHR domain-containing protein